jgi:hypothetical protein
MRLLPLQRQNHYVWGLPVAVPADGGCSISVISDSLKVRNVPHCHQHALAFAMALQPRLGAGCLARELDPEIVRLIGEQFVGPCGARLNTDV